MEEAVAWHDPHTSYCAKYGHRLPRRERKPRVCRNHINIRLNKSGKLKPLDRFPAGARHAHGETLQIAKGRAKQANIALHPFPFAAWQERWATRTYGCMVVGTFAGTVDTIGARNRVGKLPAGNNRKGMVVVAIDHWMPAEMIFSGTSRLAGMPGRNRCDDDKVNFLVARPADQRCGGHLLSDSLVGPRRAVADCQLVGPWCAWQGPDATPLGPGGLSAIESVHYLYFCHFSMPAAGRVRLVFR